MVIADLLDHGDNGKWVGRVYLSGPPFPGDVIHTEGDVSVMVIRRAFLDLGPDTETDAQRLSLKLYVREV
jgi:hypothetical protein